MGIIVVCVVEFKQVLKPKTAQIGNYFFKNNFINKGPKNQKLTPVLMLINEFGIPVCVWKAGKSFSATMRALSLNMVSPVRA